MSNKLEHMIDDRLFEDRASTYRERRQSLNLDDYDFTTQGGREDAGHELYCLFHDGYRALKRLADQLAHGDDADISEGDIRRLHEAAGLFDGAKSFGDTIDRDTAENLLQKTDQEYENALASEVVKSLVPAKYHPESIFEQAA